MTREEVLLKLAEIPRYFYNNASLLSHTKWQGIIQIYQDLMIDIYSGNVGKSGWTNIVPSELVGGKYLVDTSGSSKTYTISQSATDIEISDYKRNAGTNNITIGTSGQTFTNENGEQSAGPLMLDVDGSKVIITNITASTDFLVQYG